MVVICKCSPCKLMCRKCPMVATKLPTLLSIKTVLGNLDDTFPVTLVSSFSVGHNLFINAISDEVKYKSNNKGLLLGSLLTI